MKNKKRKLKIHLTSTLRDEDLIVDRISLMNTINSEINKENKTQRRKSDKVSCQTARNIILSEVKFPKLGIKSNNIRKIKTPEEISTNWHQFHPNKVNYEEKTLSPNPPVYDPKPCKARTAPKSNRSVDLCESVADDLFEIRNILQSKKVEDDIIEVQSSIIPMNLDSILEQTSVKSKRETISEYLHKYEREDSYEEGYELDLEEEEIELDYPKSEDEIELEILEERESIDFEENSNVEFDQSNKIEKNLFSNFTEEEEEIIKSVIPENIRNDTLFIGLMNNGNLQNIPELLDIRKEIFPNARYYPENMEEYLIEYQEEILRNESEPKSILDNINVDEIVNLYNETHVDKRIKNSIIFNYATPNSINSTSNPMGKIEINTIRPSTPFTPSSTPTNNKESITFEVSNPIKTFLTKNKNSNGEVSEEMTIASYTKRKENCGNGLETFITSEKALLEYDSTGECGLKITKAHIYTTPPSIRKMEVIKRKKMEYLRMYAEMVSKYVNNYNEMFGSDSKYTEEEIFEIIKRNIESKEKMRLHDTKRKNNIKVENISKHIPKGNNINIPNGNNINIPNIESDNFLTIDNNIIPEEIIQKTNIILPKYVYEKSAFIPEEIKIKFIDDEASQEIIEGIKKSDPLESNEYDTAYIPYYPIVIDENALDSQLFNTIIQKIHSPEYIQISNGYDGKMWVNSNNNIEYKEVEQRQVPLIDFDKNNLYKIGSKEYILLEKDEIPVEYNEMVDVINEHYIVPKGAILEFSKVMDDEGKETKIPIYDQELYHLEMDPNGNYHLVPNNFEMSDYRKFRKDALEKTPNLHLNLHKNFIENSNLSKGSSDLMKRKKLINMEKEIEEKSNSIHKEDNVVIMKKREIEKNKPNEIVYKSIRNEKNKPIYYPEDIYLKFKTVKKEDGTIVNELELPEGYKMIERDNGVFIISTEDLEEMNDYKEVEVNMNFNKEEIIKMIEDSDIEADETNYLIIKPILDKNIKEEVDDVESKETSKKHSFKRASKPSSRLRNRAENETNDFVDEVESVGDVERNEINMTDENIIKVAKENELEVDYGLFNTDIEEVKSPRNNISPRNNMSPRNKTNKKPSEIMTPKKPKSLQKNQRTSISKPKRRILEIHKRNSSLEILENENKKQKSVYKYDKRVSSMKKDLENSRYNAIVTQKLREMSESYTPQNPKDILLCQDDTPIYGIPKFEYVGGAHVEFLLIDTVPLMVSQHIAKEALAMGTVQRARTSLYNARNNNDIQQIIINSSILEALSQDSDWEGFYMRGCAYKEIGDYKQALYDVSLSINQAKSDEELIKSFVKRSEILDIMGEKILSESDLNYVNKSIMCRLESYFQNTIFHYSNMEVICLITMIQRKQIKCWMKQ